MGENNTVLYIVTKFIAKSVFAINPNSVSLCDTSFILAVSVCFKMACLLFIII